MPGKNTAPRGIGRWPSDGGRLSPQGSIRPPGSIRPRSGGRPARLAAIIDSSDDAIVSKTLDGVITSWNRAAERIFGYTAAEAVGRHITLIIPEERHAEEREVLARLVKGERIDHFETIRQTKDGRLIDISLTVSPIRNAAGRVVGASKMARDISDRRRLERERAGAARAGAGRPRRGRGLESQQGSVPRDAVARAPDPAQRHLRLGPHARRGPSRRADDAPGDRGDPPQRGARRCSSSRTCSMSRA